MSRFTTETRAQADVFMVIDEGLDATLNGTEDEGAAAIFPAGMFKEIQLPID